MIIPLMNYEELREHLKKIDFDKTEPETLIKLIQSAEIKGDETRKELAQLNKLTEKIVDELLPKNFFLFHDYNEELVEKFAVGIDGSFQLAGGIGGKWYLFLSNALIVFKDGVKSDPQTTIWADILTLNEIDNPKVGSEATVKMLSGESKSILFWGSKKIPSVLFIDGPVIDPPFPFHNDESYINYRCEAIRACEKSIIVACVKRIRDRFFIDYIKNTFSISAVQDFPTDQHLMIMLFTKLRQKQDVNSIFTKWLDVTDYYTNQIPYKKYRENGIHIISFFYEKDLKSSILRIDIPIPFLPSTNIEFVDNLVVKIVNCLDYWTYSGLDPIPVFLAHEKCNIRKGAAEVLYEDILTKSRTGDPFEQMIATRMR
jgi:hypothetical protein